MVYLGNISTIANKMEVGEEEEEEDDDDDNTMQVNGH